MYIKNTKDLILGIFAFTGGIWLIFDKKLIQGFALFTKIPFFARPDVYVRILAIFWTILSFLLIIKSISIKKNKKKIRFSVNIPLVVLLQIIVLIIYAFVLECIGFFISSFVLVAFLCFIYQFYDKNMKMKKKEEIIKSLITSCSFSLIIVVVLERVFTQLLKIKLP